MATKPEKSKDAEKIDKTALAANVAETRAVGVGGDDPMSLFVDDSAYTAPQGAIVKSMSPMLKPAQFPIGKVLVGIFAKMFSTKPADGKIGTGIEIVPQGAAVGVALPAVATILTGLEISGGDTKTPTSPHIGRKVAIKLLPNKIPSKKGNDAWNFVCIIYPETAGTLTA